MHLRGYVPDLLRLRDQKNVQFKINNTDDLHETNSEDRDQDFVAALLIMPERPSSSSRNDPTSPEDTYSKIPVRTSLKCSDKSIIRCAIHCLCDHKISRDDIVGIIVKTAKSFLGRNGQSIQISLMKILIIPSQARMNQKRAQPPTT